MKKYMAEGSDVMTVLGLSDDCEPHPTPVYQYIAFKQQITFTGLAEVPYLRANATDTFPGTPLDYHPVVEATFAVFPPVVRIGMLRLPEFPSPTNELGVTVGDFTNNMTR